jgi:delta24-sterol reductase
MVMGDATKVICSPTENPELFSAIPFSYGTLGFLMSVDIDIIPYKPYMKQVFVSSVGRVKSN